MDKFLRSARDLIFTKWRNFLAAGLLIAACDRACAQPHEAQPKATAPTSTSDIVVTGRRSRAIQAKDVVDTVPPRIIKAYGADSIGELMNRLSTRFGRNFSVLVNGRRLAAVDAVNALPPEALEKIEVLTPSKASEFGLPAGEALINLALRPRFQFATIESEGSVTTEGAGDSENVALRYSRIRKDNQFNVALAYNRQGGILESQRAGSAQPVSAPYRSLTPRQDALTLTTGYSRPLGSLNLDLSSELSFFRTGSLTGLINNTAEIPANSIRASSQQSTTKTIRSGATISGNAGQYFWSLLLNGEMNWTATTNRQGQLVDLVPANVGQVSTLSPDVRSKTESVGVALNFAGPLFVLPAGSVTIDGSVNVRLNDLTSIVAPSPASSVSNHYTAMSAQGGVTVPITRQGASFLGFMGNLSFGQRFDYMRNSGFGGALTTTSSFDWTPSSGLLISLSRSSSPGLPSATVLFAPLIKRPGVLIYDAFSNTVVPVTIISGGRSDIPQSKSSSTSLQTSYQSRLPFANASTSLNYTATQTLSPLVSFSNPSPLAQLLLTHLFFRGADGKITEFDSRPFSGQDETIRQISANFHLNGPVAKIAVSDGTAIISAPASPSGPAWDLNISYSYMLSHRLNLGGDRSAIDLLATPLSLSGSARHHLNVQWALGKENYGLNGSISWDSGSRVQSLDDEKGTPVHFSSITKVGLEAFVELDKSPNADNPRSLRIKLGVDNLFNQRLRVSGYNGLNEASQRFMIDPYGRIIRVTLRKSL